MERTVSRYDTLTTRRYKMADVKGTTFRMIVSPNGRDLMDLVSYVRTNRSNGLTLSQISNTLRSNGTPVDIKTLIMATYAGYIMNEGEITDLDKLDILTQVRQMEGNEQNDQVSDLDSMYQEAFTSYESNKNSDAATASELRSIHANLENSWNYGGQFVSTPVRILSSSYNYKPKWKGYRGTSDIPTIRDAHHIFDTAVVSQYLPYIQYVNGKGESYYKLYRGTRPGIEPDYSYVTTGRSKRSRNNTIYMTLWLGNSDGIHDSDEFYTDIKDTFHAVVYNLNTGDMKVNVPSELRWMQQSNTEPLAKSRLESVLNELTLGESSVVAIKAELSLYPIHGNIGSDGTIDTPAPEDQFVLLDYVLLHWMLLEPTYYRYLYVREIGRPYPTKKRFTMNYRPAFDEIVNRKPGSTRHYSTVTFGPRIDTTIAAQSMNVMMLSPYSLNQPVKITVPAKYNYLKINISDAVSLDAINDFVKIFVPLMNIYQWGKAGNSGTRKAVTEFYTHYVPGSERPADQLPTTTTSKIPTGSTTKSIMRGKMVNDLSAAFPAIFGGKWSRACQQKFQPVIMNEENKAKFEQETFEYKGGVMKKTTIPYPAPPEEPLFWVGCPTADQPWPRVTKNKNYNGAPGTYPYAPCCTKGKAGGLLYKKYYLNAQPKLTIRTNVILIGKLLNPGTVGKISLIIENFLSNYDTKNGTFLHYGVDRSPNSLLHAVLTAVNDEGYRSLLMNTPEAREAYVSRVRLWLSTITDPALLRQELYDVDSKTIINTLANPKLYLDPNTYYRALEEAWGVNIYTFSPSKGALQTEGKINVPRHRYFHSRPQRLERPTILIYEYYGIESDNLTYPQCDIIIIRDYSIPQVDLRLYDSPMTEMCTTLINQVQGIITWAPSDDCDEEQPQLEAELIPSELCLSNTVTVERCPTVLTAYDNIYNVVNFGVILGGNVTSQYIDTNGKARAFTFILTDRNQQVTIIIPPTQPCNVPHTDVITATSDVIAVQLLGQPTAAVRDNDNRINGLWFRLIGIDHGMFVKISTLSTSGELQYRDLPDGPVEPLTVGSESITDRITGLRKKLSIITQVLRWIFDIWREDGGQHKDSKRGDLRDDYIKFANQHITVANTAPNIDSLKYYDLSKLSNVLPTLDELKPQPGLGKVHSALRYIARYAPTLVHNDAIVMYNETFKQHMVGDLERYMLATYNDLNMELSTEIINQYVTESDFTRGPGVEIFINASDLDHWLRDHIKPVDTIDISDKLTLDKAMTIIPYLYRAIDEKIYIVQNPADGSLSTSCAIGAKWNASKYNPGPYVGSVSGTLPNHVIYGITPGGQLTIIADNSGNSETYLRILTYKTEDDRINGRDSRYGCMLELI